MKILDRLLEILMPFVLIIVYMWNFFKDNEVIVWGVVVIVCFIGINYNKLCEINDKLK